MTNNIFNCLNIWKHLRYVTIDVCHVSGMYHYDVIKWKHFPRYWPFVRGIYRSLVNSPHKGQWRGALIFSLTCAWINGPVNNRVASDLRRHCAHYDVIVMSNQRHVNHTMCEPSIIGNNTSQSPFLLTWIDFITDVITHLRHFLYVLSDTEYIKEARTTGHGKIHF